MRYELRFYTRADGELTIDTVDAVEQFVKRCIFFTPGIENRSVLRAPLNVATNCRALCGTEEDVE